MGATISAVIITKNEERHIGECLALLDWADERIVVDSFSTDRTVELASVLGASVHRHPFVSFPRQRNAALALAKCDWVFFVDADERVSAPLADEIRAVIAEGERAAAAIAGYWVPRRNLILGKWIRGGGWYPDYQLRLLRRGYASYDEEREVHEVVKLDGAEACIEHTLTHHNYERLGQLLSKQRQYAALQARTMFRAGIRPRPRNYVVQPLREFHRRYVQLRGYQDGAHGLLLAAIMGYYTLSAYRQLGQMERGKGWN